MNDLVNHPPHYNSHPSGIECIEITRHMNFNTGNAFKYLFRRTMKESERQNVEKAIWYLRDEIKRLAHPGAQLPEFNTLVAATVRTVVSYEPENIARAMLAISDVAFLRSPYPITRLGAAVAALHDALDLDLRQQFPS